MALVGSFVHSFGHYSMIRATYCLIEFHLMDNEICNILLNVLFTQYVCTVTTNTAIIIVMSSLVVYVPTVTCNRKIAV